MESEDYLKEKLQSLQKQLAKKQTFEEAVASIKSILTQHAPSASPSLRKTIYSVVLRAATILQTRYTAPGFWLAGKGLFEEAERLATESSVKDQMRACIKKSREHLNNVENQPEVSEPVERESGYLFEGHLTVDPEPPQPQWLVAQQYLSSLVANADEDNTIGERASGYSITTERALEMMEFFNGTRHSNELTAAVEASLEAIGSGPSRKPRKLPASKDVVKKLPVITVTEEVLARLGNETVCVVCRENLLVHDKMQELHGWMRTTHVQYASSNCQRMTMHMRARKSDTKRLKKKERVLQMQHVAVNLCMLSLNTLALLGWAEIVGKCK